MPGNGFSFAVRVGCKQDFIRLARGFLELFDDGVFAFGDIPVRFESSLDVDAKAAFAARRKIADMALRSHDDIILAQVAGDGFAFLR